MALGAFATSTLLTKNSFLEEIRKQYVLTARAKGCNERQVLYGHVFRNAMLIVIAGFPGTFILAFFARLAADRDHLLARRPRPARLRERSSTATTRWCWPRSTSSRWSASSSTSLSDLVYTWVDPRIDFETRGGLRNGRARDH